MHRLTFLLTVAVILTPSCAWGPETARPDEAILGTVEFVEVEGGCWRIRADDGTSYEPLNMPEEFVKDGLRVAVVFSFPEDLVSICQVGILANVESVEQVNNP